MTHVKIINNDKTYNEPQLFVVSGVHGLALLNAAAAVGLALDIKSDPAQLEDDVPLSLHTHTDNTNKVFKNASDRSGDLLKWQTKTHLVLWVHLGHHSVLKEVKGQDLQHIELMGHLIVYGFVASDHILKT